MHNSTVQSSPLLINEEYVYILLAVSETIVPNSVQSKLEYY